MTHVLMNKVRVEFTIYLCSLEEIRSKVQVLLGGSWDEDTWMRVLECWCGGFGMQVSICACGFVGLCIWVSTCRSWGTGVGMQV